MMDSAEPASFRDPSGFVFRRDGAIYRHVSPRYRADYDQLMASGLYESLAADGLLVRHTESDRSETVSPGAYRVLKPELIEFISYPYEWCFSQLRDAALITLEIQKRALAFGMSLKDASAYNIQFQAGRPVLIDTLSFESYEEGRPWIAYRQFCQHFLAPLALIQWTDALLAQLLRANLDGIPLDLASRLLPLRTRLKPGLLTHIHLHAAVQSRASVTPRDSRAKPVHSMSRTALLGLIDSLESAVRRASWNPRRTVWSDYYSTTNYSDAAMDSKQRTVGDMLDSVEPRPNMVWDLGANTGQFSRLAAERGILTVAWDLDPVAVERNYLECRRGNETMILPLVQDMSNPSPAIGWHLEERRSLIQRGPADVLLALALVHHLAIAGNVPLDHIARFFAGIGKALIIEFVPKRDSQVQRLLSGREDIFDRYSIEDFEREFAKRFEILRRAPIEGSERVLYLMRASNRANQASRSDSIMAANRELATIEQ